MTTIEVPNLATYLSNLDFALKDFAHNVTEHRKKLAQMTADAMGLAYDERDELAASDKTEAALLELMANDLAEAAKILNRIDLRHVCDIVARAAHMANRDPSRPLGVHPSNRPQSDD